MPQNEKTILFIEDDPDQQKMYSFILKKAGFKVFQALS
jgi:DNA-binding response OmpR family regulator